MCPWKAKDTPIHNLTGGDCAMLGDTKGVERDSFSRNHCTSERQP